MKKILISSLTFIVAMLPLSLLSSSNDNVNSADVNHDGEVNISDVNAVIDIILGGSHEGYSGDVNNDGETNISDINYLIDIILGAKPTAVPVINTQIVDNAVIITAIGNGNVCLYVNGLLVSNPYVAIRGNVDYVISVYATAKEDGKLMSQSESINVLIPAMPITATPEVTADITEDAVIITASGDGVVKLYVNDSLVENPYTAPRSDVEYELTVYATAQEEGKALSQSDHQCIIIPALDKNEIETFTVNGVSFSMVAVEGGTFMMGATEEQGNNVESGEKPPHQVTLSGYYICQTEVTQALWVAVMGNNPSCFNDDLQRPVESVGWWDCQMFICKLNKLTGKTFRLPTEAEWEFAARGGIKSQGYKFAGSNNLDEVAWYGNNCTQCTHKVAQKQPNELGLYDMSGNVYEWCQDWHGYFSDVAQNNPTGPTEGLDRIGRGGCWLNPMTNCRVSSRFATGPDNSDNYMGLRLSMDYDNSSKFRLSETVVEIETGCSRVVNILNGSGNYCVEGPLEMVNVDINNEQLIMTGKAVGTNSITLIDINTGSQTTITFIIKESVNEMFTVNGVSFKMVAVEGGTFTMGATDDDTEAWDNEKPAHQVTLSSYAIGETEVTQALWLAVMGNNPSYFTSANGYTDDLNRPVEFVSWYDCQAFIANLNELTGKTFRLPTEAEWEFAARGGNKSQSYKYAGGNTLEDVAWCYYNSSSTPHPVATKNPNELGLYDMSGNVWEWVQDWYGNYSSDAQTNPTGPASGTIRVSRGGAWDNTEYCRVSMRTGGAQTYSCDAFGLRLTLSPDNGQTPEEHEWVDLGLPSGTLWATCNIGANAPEEYGDYFAWGETSPKETYSWSTYKWCNGSYNKLTKYSTDTSYGYNGFVDNKTELDPEDDVAYMSWGENWRIPTYDQQTELRTECTWTWTTRNGVYGRLVTGPNGASLFLPATGCRDNSSLWDAGSFGYYWSRSLSSSGPYDACRVTLYYSGVDWMNTYRFYGLAVRPVRVSQK